MIESGLCSLEEKSNALVKALNSRVFSRSEQLKAFLRYICSAESARPGMPLSEYVIGVEVLGRREGYSPAEDSSVRTRAYDLRQKLEKLYTVELPEEEIQIVVPKGTYTPQYQRRVPERPVAPLQFSTVTEEALPSPSATPAAPKAARLRSLAAVFLAAFAGVVFTWAATRLWRPGAERDPILAEAWGPLVQAPNPVLVTVATPLSLVVGPAGHQVFGSPNYPAPPETYPMFRAHRLLAPEELLGLTFSDNMLAAGTMNAALICATTLRGFDGSYQLLPDRMVSASALRGHNAILLGAAVDSETITVAMQDMPLTVEFSPGLHEFVVRDHVSGKLFGPKRDSSGDLAEVYGLITVRDSHEDRNRGRMLLLSGITSVGIQGAAEFFSSPAAMRSVRSIFEREGLKRFPSVYQIVVRCRCNKLLLLSSSYFQHRLITRD